MGVVTVYAAGWLLRVRCRCLGQMELVSVKKDCEEMMPVLHDWKRQVNRLKEREKQWESESEKAKERVRQCRCWSCCCCCCWSCC